MRLYKTTFLDDARPQERSECASWDGTLADAAKTRKLLKVESMRNIDTAEVEVPTDKAGLLAFVNTWCVVR